MTTALLTIDVQNDFCPGGALAVSGGDEILPLVNGWQQDYTVRVFTQDWHPADHSSFADNHSGKQPYEMIDMPYGPQVLWPRHCVQGSSGAAFHEDLQLDPADLIIRKGFRPEIDSYSAFFENDKTTATGLAGYLRERGVTDVALCGLATDFCVYYSAIDAVKQGFGATLLLDGCRGIDLHGSMDAALSDMVSQGVVISSKTAA
jgi:nicotinamidase/pyrazinamidase